MGNSYCKKDCSKGEINVVEITQIRLEISKKNVAMGSFCCLVSKSILCCFKEKKNP